MRPAASSLTRHVRDSHRCWRQRLIQEHIVGFGASKPQPLGKRDYTVDLSPPLLHTTHDDGSSTINDVNAKEETTRISVPRSSSTEETTSTTPAATTLSTTKALLKQFGVADPMDLETIYDSEKLESYVKEIEGQKQQMNQDVIQTIIVPLMQATSRINTNHGAQMTERLLCASLGIDTIDGSEMTTAVIDPSWQLPNEDMYNLCITSWTRALLSNTGAHQATKVLAMMVNMYNRSVELVGEEDTQKINTAKPNRIHFTSVMHAWAKSKLHMAPQQVSMLLEQLEKESGVFDYLEQVEDKQQLHQKKPYEPNSLTPDRACYNTVMSTFAHSQSSHPLAASMVPRLFRRLQKVHSLAGTDECEPDTISYNLLINTISRTNPVNPRDAENILKDMLAQYKKKRDESDTAYIPTSTYPNIQTYNGIIQAWSNSGHPDAPIRVESILMALIGQQHHHPTERLLDLPIVDDVSPDTYTFNSVISCWARSGLPDAGERAEQLLSLMETGSRSSSNPSGDIALANVQADIVTYNSVMNAWARSGRGEEGARRAEEILNMVIDRTTVLPTVVTYSTAIQAWSNSQSPMAGIKAQELLNQLEESYDLTKNRQLRPNDTCYSGVLRAWVRQQQQRQQVDDDETDDDKCPLDYAEELLLERMRRRSKYVSPNTRHLNIILEGWANHSNAEDAAQRAQMLLTNAARKGVASPNATSFNHAIAACARSMPDTNKRRHAFFAGLDLFNRLGASGGRPGERTYRLMFQLFDAHIPPKERMNKENMRFAIDLFRTCCNDGWMTDSVLHAVQSFFPLEVLGQLIPGLPTKRQGQNNKPTSSTVTLSSNNLPPKWSRNGRTRRKHSNQR